MVFLVSFLSIHILQQDLKRWLVLWSWNLFTCDYSLQWNRGQLLFWVTTKSFSWSVQLVSREKLEQSPRSISQAVWASNGKRLLERHWGMGFLFFHLTLLPCLVLAWSLSPFPLLTWRLATELVMEEVSALTLHRTTVSCALFYFTAVPPWAQSSRSLILSELLRHLEQLLG